MILAPLVTFDSRSAEPSYAEGWRRWRQAYFALGARPYQLYCPSRLALAPFASDARGTRV